METTRTVTDDEYMIRKLIVGSVVGFTFLAGAAWIYASYMDSQMDSGVLEERLAGLPVPDLVLVDEWHLDGSWMFKPREPEAVRLYIAAGNVDEKCKTLDDFYESRGISISPTSMSGDPTDWCGRSVTTSTGRISIWVESLKSWTARPAEFADEPDLVQIQYSAHRR